MDNFVVTQQTPFRTSRQQVAAFSQFAKIALRSSTLRPVFLALAGVAVALVGVWVVPGLIDSVEQRVLHRGAVHRDATAVKTGAVLTIKTPTTLVYRDVNGILHRLLADENEANRFINETLIFLDSERSKIKAETQKATDALLVETFSDSDASIARYADWYFQWERSWAFLKEAAAGGVKGLGVNNVQGFFEASRNEVEDYLIRNYQRFVLKPELRDPVLEAGISRILAHAHDQYVATLASIDLRTQVFLSSSTQHLEIIDPRGMLNVSADWDAQKWKAPRYSVDDEAFRAILRGTGLLTVSALVAQTVGPTVERAIAQICLAAASRIAATIQPQALGLLLGSIAEPGGGSLAGWAVGAGGALAFDYLSNLYREHRDRADFQMANAEALKITTEEWSRAFQRDLFRAVDAWFDDTRSVIAEQKLYTR
jgi:hypothetical protein